MSSPFSLRIENLTKRFEALTAVSNLNIEVRAGEIYALIGPNGSGKTTTVKTITGLYRPTAGDIFVGGSSITKEPEKTKRQIGYIPDEPFVYERMTGREFLHLVGALFDIPPQDREIKIEKLLDTFSLAPIIDGFVENYSRGNKQKVSILAALLHEPKLLVVDEPIVGLDPESTIKAREIFTEFTKNGGAVFLCTHTLSFAESISSRIGLLQGGKLVEEGTLETLRRKSGKMQANLEEIYLHFTKP